mgnify:CR=1 FL=1
MSALPQDVSPAPNTRRVRFFRNGANQAVRIPREFELPGEEAVIEQIGNTLVIKPVKPNPPKGSPEAVALMLEELRALGPCPDEFPDVDEGLLPLDDIEL